MAQLTWRNIDAPDFSASIRALSDSNNQLQRAFSGVGQAFTDYGVRREGENTGNIELALAKYGTNADLQAAIQQGLLDPNALRQQYGNFDAGAIAKYQNTLANDLQTREVNQQGIDQTNNLNLYGGRITDALTRARQNDRSGLDTLSADPGLLGSVLSRYAQNFAGNLGEAGQDAESIRSHRASEANAAANTAIARDSLSLRQKEYDAGQVGRDVANLRNEQLLSNNKAMLAGAADISKMGDDSFSTFRQAQIERLQKEQKSPDYIANYIGGLEKSFTQRTSANPNAPVADAVIASDIAPQVQGNTQAATDSLNAQYDAKNPLMKTYRAAQEDGTDYKGDSTKAIDAILSFAPDSDRSAVRDYIREAQEQKIPLKDAVAAARNNTESTKWGAVKSVIPWATDNSSQLDRGAALDTAKQLQNSNAKQELASLNTQMNVDKQAVTAAEQSVNAAANLFKERATLFGAKSPQAQAAKVTLDQALEAQRNVANGYRNASVKSLNTTRDLSEEDLRRAAILREQQRRAGIAP